jgi:hypothetical protein
MWIAWSSPVRDGGFFTGSWNTDSHVTSQTWFWDVQTGELRLRLPGTYADGFGPGGALAVTRAGGGTSPVRGLEVDLWRPAELDSDAAQAGISSWALVEQQGPLAGSPLLTAVLVPLYLAGNASFLVFLVALGRALERRRRGLAAGAELAGAGGVLAFLLLALAAYSLMTVAAQGTEGWGGPQAALTVVNILIGVMSAFMGAATAYVSFRWHRRLSSGDDMTGTARLSMASPASTDNAPSPGRLVIIGLAWLSGLVLTFVVVAYLDGTPRELSLKLWQRGIGTFGTQAGLVLCVLVFVAFAPAVLLRFLIAGIGADLPGMRARRAGTSLPDPSHRLIKLELIAVNLAQPTRGMLLTFWLVTVIAGLAVTGLELRERWVAGAWPVLAPTNTIAWNSGTTFSEIYTGAWHLSATVFIAVAVFWTVVSVLHLVKLARQARTRNRSRCTSIASTLSGPALVPEGHGTPPAP